MKRTAFTFTELLVIVGIIGLLVALIMPSVNRVRELARRTSCAASLKAIGIGVHQYAQTLGYNSNLPWCQEDAGGLLANDNVGNNRTDPNPGSTGSPTRQWFMLVIGKYAQLGLFGCPSDRNQTKLNYDNLASQVMPPTKDDRANAIYDFATTDGQHPVGYAFQVTKTSKASGAGVALSLADNSGMPIAADFNGNTMWSTMTASSAQVVRDPAQPVDANSPNHNREGQNVLTLQGTVLWKTTARCGINLDNIYTRRSDANNMTSDVNDSTSGYPIDHTDSVLMP
jgi:competence protein ComGC